jgi:hypothetical protein
MRLAREYTPDPVLEEPVRRQFLKGVGAAVTVFALYLGAIAALGARTGEPAALAVDAAAVLGVLVVAQVYSRRVAERRVEAAREASRTGRFDQAIALLLPFAQAGRINLRSRFDRTGEAHFLLAQAARQEGEEDLFRYCLVFLLRFRRGDWADRAKGLQVSEDQAATR